MKYCCWLFGGVLILSLLASPGGPVNVETSSVVTRIPPANRKTTTSYVREHIPDRLKTKIWQRDKGMCQANWQIDSSLDKNSGEICGDREKLEFDHIIPVARGGKSTYRNLQLLCEKHNRMKGKK